VTSYRLENGLRLDVPRAKLTSFLLDPQHRQNKGRAKLLFSYGFGPVNPSGLEYALLGQAANGTVQPAAPNPYGKKYTVRGLMDTPCGVPKMVLTVWQVDPDSGVARFVTIYPVEGHADDS
jgi:hypothetical protein